MNEDKKTKDLMMKLGWVLFLMLLAFLLGMVFRSSLVGAVSWPMDKPTTCNVFNLTGEACEQFWCNSIIECNYSTVKSACICTNMVNVTITNYVNVTTNLSNSTFIYGNNSDVFGICKNYTDIQLGILRDSLLDRVENETALWKTGQYNNNSSQTSSEPMPYWVWIAIALILVAGLAFMSYNFTKSKQHETPKPFRRSFSGISKFYGEKSDKPKEQNKEEDKKE